MKKLFSLFAALTLSAGLWAQSVGDKFVDETSGLKFEITAVGGTNTVKVIANNYTGTSYTIPATVSYQSVTFNVTEIGIEAFEECSSLTSVTIGNSVTSIGGYAFEYCSGLTSVTIGNSVTTIGEGAFEECSSLTSVTIPNSVTTIGIEAFGGCSGLTSVTIPNSVTTIGGAAFQGCSGLTSIVVENGNSVYDSRNNCNAIIETSSNTLIAGFQNTTIPNSVTSIGGYAFYYCTSLTSVTIPNSVTTIGEGAFWNCTGLTSVTIGNSVTSIGASAFGNVGDPDPALLTLPNSWTGTLPDEDGYWYGGKFELSEVPTALPTLFGDDVKANKFLHNGQLIIRKAGRDYNALGQEVR